MFASHSCRSQSRMAAVAQLFLLLFAVTNNIHAEEHIIIEKERGSLTIEPPMEVDLCIINTFVGEGKRVVLNNSDLWSRNSTAPEHLKERLPVVSRATNSSYMMHNMSLSHSGVYHKQCWMDGKVAYEKNITIVVCTVQ